MYSSDSNMWRQRWWSGLRAGETAVPFMYFLDFIIMYFSYYSKCISLEMYSSDSNMWRQRWWSGLRACRPHEKVPLLLLHPISVLYFYWDCFVFVLYFFCICVVFVPYLFCICVVSVLYCMRKCRSSSFIPFSLLPFCIAFVLYMFCICVVFV